MCECLKIGKNGSSGILCLVCWHQELSLLYPMDILIAHHTIQDSNFVLTRDDSGLESHDRGSRGEDSMGLVTLGSLLSAQTGEDSQRRPGLEPAALNISSTEGSILALLKRTSLLNIVHTSTKRRKVILTLKWEKYSNIKFFRWVSPSAETK